MPNNNGNIWMQAAAGAAQGAMALGLQRIGVGYDYRKQLEQQGKLSELQLQMESRLMDIQNQKQFEMWQKTGPTGYKAELLKAGLNPALMYGMSGGGGQSMGAGMPNATGGVAPDPNTRGAAVMQIGLQGALLKAQIDNINAQTKNLNQSTAKSWQETHAIEMENLLNEIAQNVDENGQNTQGNIHNSAAVKAKLQTLMGEGIRNELAKSNINLNEGQIKKMAADITQRAEEIAIESRSVSVEEQQVLLNKMLAEFNTDWKNIIGKEALETVSGLIKNLPFINLLKGAKRPPSVQGFGGKKPY